MKAHLGPALGTGQRECPVDARQQHHPEVAGRRASQGCGGRLNIAPGERRGLHRGGLGGQDGDRGTQGRIGSQHVVLAMAMHPRRGNQRGDAPDKLQGREDELGAPIRAGSG